MIYITFVGTLAEVGTNANDVDEVDAIPFDGMHIGPAAQVNFLFMI